MEPLKGHLDFEFATMRGELVREIEAAINKEAPVKIKRKKVLPPFNSAKRDILSSRILPV